MRVDTFYKINKEKIFTEGRHEAQEDICARTRQKKLQQKKMWNEDCKLDTSSY